MRDRKKREDNTDIVTIKCALRTIVRRPFQNIITNYISDKSIESSKICILGSLLFLEKVQRAFETNHFEFFNGDGEGIIKDCFYGILGKNINLPGYKTQEFRTMAGQLFTWPENSYFGNAFGDLIDTYITNVKNNLNTHCKSRLTQYLKMRVFLNNSGDFQLIRYNDEDIKHAVNWAIYKRDIVIRTMDDVAKRQRRNYLLQMISGKSMFDIPNNDVASFTKQRWFKSIQMWIGMQREIDIYNTETRRNNHSYPVIKNLTVIPICKPTRTHFSFDTYTLYKFLCATSLIPIENGKQICFKEVSDFFCATNMFIVHL